MSHGGDALHFDRVHLLERVIEDTGGVDDLPSQVLVVEMPNKERFCCEGIWLDIDVGPSHLVDEGWFSNVGISTDKERSGVRVNIGETWDVLSDLLEVREGVFLTSHDRCHAANILSVILQENKVKSQRTDQEKPSSTAYICTSCLRTWVSEGSLSQHGRSDGGRYEVVLKRVCNDFCRKARSSTRIRTGEGPTTQNMLYPEIKISKKI